MSLLRTSLALLSLSVLRPSAPTPALHWHTDLEEAKAAAAASGRPILSLRMLGRLDEELSCANSRFFRSVLYVDPQVAAILSERFVLHWSSERSVPVISIDFGDGRAITRTITGNSAHYVLDAQGRVIDVIPGLYSPAAFVEQLQAALLRPDARVHQVLADHIARSWSSQLERVGVRPSELARGRAPADKAVRIAVTKMVVELPMVAPASELARITDDQTWDRMLEGPPRATLSEAAIARMRAQNPSLDETTFSAMVLRFKQSLDRDTLQNEMRLHQRIHAYLAEHDRPAFAEMNAWVYDQLFATPAGDPWLGLHEDTIYTGLQDAGIHRR